MTKFPAENFFCYDPDAGGITFFETEAEAREAAQESIDMYRDAAADGGWEEHVESVCWGAVHQRAKLREIPDMLVETDEGLQPAVDAALENTAHPSQSAGEPVAIVDVSVPHLRSIVVKVLPEVDVPPVGALVYTSPPPTTVQQEAGEPVADERARAVLAELVAVKDLKERTEALYFAGPTSEHGEGWKDVYEAQRKEYLRRQPAAWAAATAALASPPPTDAARVEADRRDAVLGRVALRFMDRAGDPVSGIDDAGTILREFHEAMSAALAAERKERA